MKKLYKKIAIILCIAMLISAGSFILSACGPSTNTATITFKQNYSDCPADIIRTVKIGEKVGSPTPKDRANYTFAGWYIDSACTAEYVFDKAVDKDFTLYAKWELMKFTITWNLNYTGNPGNTTTTAEYGSKIPEPTPPTRTGYVFAYWHTAASGNANNRYDFNTLVTANRTLYASWTSEVSYTITLNTNGGSAISPITKAANATLALSELSTTQSGYVVKEWRLNDAAGAIITFPYTVTGNVTLFAVWQEQATQGTAPVFSGRFAYGDQVDNTYVLTLKAGGVAELTTNGGGLVTGTWTYDSGTDVYTVTCGDLNGAKSTKAGGIYTLVLSLWGGMASTNLTYNPAV